jgi:predicted ATP-dependent endonuclease of OLD family
MKINHLIINNFRSYKNLELFFNWKYTSIVWENGSWKTSILDAIYLAFSYWEVKEKIKLSDFYKNTNIPISIKIYFDKNFIAKIKNGFEDVEIPCKWISLKIKKANNIKKNFFENFEIEHYAIPEKIIETYEQWWLVQDHNTKKEKLLEISKEILSFPINTKNLPKIFYFDKYRNKKYYSWEYLNSSHLTKWSKEILEIFSQDDWEKLNEIFESIENFIEKNASEKIDSKNIFPSKKELKNFNINNYLDSCQENFSKLWEWLETIINIILTANIAKILEKNIIFLIDKPELHLHPQLQKILFDYIENNTFQYIYSTHSDLMIKINKWQNIIRLHSYEKFPKASILKEKIWNVTIKNLLLKLENNYKYETIFFRENNELFFAKKIILVEWPIEKVCLPILFEKYNKQKYLKEFTIISVNWKWSMQHFQIICKTFWIDYFSLFDADKEAIKKWMNHFLIERSFKEHFYFFRTSFEKVLTIKNAKNKAQKTIELILELEKQDFPKEYDEMMKKLILFLDE